MTVSIQVFSNFFHLTFCILQLSLTFYNPGVESDEGEGEEEQDTKFIDFDKQINIDQRLLAMTVCNYKSDNNYADVPNNKKKKKAQTANGEKHKRQKVEEE